MYRVVLMKNDEVVKDVQFSELFLAISTLKMWDRKFSLEKGFYICLERI